MSITVKEKDHWRSRIGKRIERRIETVVAKEDPTLLQRVKEQAHDKAYESLGIQAQRQELEELEKQKEKIEKRERRLEAEQRAILKGIPVEEELGSSRYSYDSTVQNAVTARAAALEADILAEFRCRQTGAGLARREGQSARHGLASDFKQSDQGIVGAGELAPGGETHGSGKESSGHQPHSG